MLCEPLRQMGLLAGLKRGAVADAVEGFREGAIGGGDGVGVEEGGDLVVLFGGAEGVGGADDALAGEGGELSLDAGPVCLDPGPGGFAGVAALEHMADEAAGILVADGAGGGVLESAGDESGVGEVAEAVEELMLEAGAGLGLCEMQKAIVERGVAVGGGEGEGDVNEGGVFVFVSEEGSFGDAAGFGENLGVAGFAEDAKEFGAAAGAVVDVRGGGFAGAFVGGRKV